MSAHTSDSGCCFKLPTLFTACLLSWALVSSAQVTLTTTHPGPYRFQIEGTPYTSGMVQIAMGTVTQQVHVTPGWTSLAWPESAAPTDCTIRWERAETRPRMQIHAIGDPLRLVTFAEGLILDSSRAPTALSRPDSTLTTLLPGVVADAIRVTLKSEDTSTREPMIEVAIEETAFTPATQPAGKIHCAIVPRPTTGESPIRLTLRSLEGPLPASFTVIVQPLFRTLVCRPTQTGIYVFDAFDADAAQAFPLARGLVAHQTVSIPASHRWIGGCRRFVPEGDTVTSHFMSDEIFEFSGFHERERSETASPPFQRWTAGSNASIRITAPRDCECEVTLHMQSACPDEVFPTNALLIIETNRIPVVFKEGDWSGTLAIPSRPGDQDGILIGIQSRTWRPSDTAASQDSRTLGLLLDHFEVRFGFSGGAVQDPAAERGTAHPPSRSECEPASAPPAR